MNLFKIEELTIEKVDSKVFNDGFEEEKGDEFSEFLHSGNSIYYSENEQLKYKSFKPEFKEEAFLYFLAKYKGEVVGRSFSNQISLDSIMMCMSYVKKDFRKNGIYGKLLDKTLELAEEIGYRKVLSYHNTTNNEIIIPKLKKGFCFTGMKVNAGYGTLAELTLYFNENERDAVDFRTGFRRPTDFVSRVLKL